MKFYRSWCAFRRSYTTKTNLFLLVFIVQISCLNPDKADSDIKESPSEIVSSPVEIDTSQSIQQADSKTQIENEDWLTPAYLTGDFNKDNQTDTAFAVIVEGYPYGQRHLYLK